LTGAAAVGMADLDSFGRALLVTEVEWDARGSRSEGDWENVFLRDHMGAGEDTNT
jgi:hypothetical protein